MPAAWLPGVIAAAGTGVLGATIGGWFQRPAAHEAAERLRNNRIHHRDVIENARTMTGQAQWEHWPISQVATSKPFLDIRPHLGPGVIAEVARGHLADLTVLLDDIDRLEREWKLV